MAYTIDFSDGSKNPITVEDNTINNETSLKIPGKNSLGYGQVIAEDLIRLLENFASGLEPANPVEGQLWFDTSGGENPQLKVYDGTKFTSAGGLQKSDTLPAVAESTTGDLWVDKSKQQLYLFSGSEWLLVGPQYSDGLTTGLQVTQLIGTDDFSYNVIKLEVSANCIAIVAFDTFVPKLFINGFAGKTLYPGFNLATRDTNSDNENDVKYFGVSEKAESLIVNDKVVSANNFLRSDTESTTNYGLNISNNTGLAIGPSKELTLNINNGNGIFRHTIDAGDLSFQTKQSGSTSTVLNIGSNKRVGINTVVPDAALEVVGDVKSSGKLTITDTTSSTSIATGSIITSGGVGVNENLNVGGSTTIEESLSVGNQYLAALPASHDRPEGDVESDLILPDSDNARNIGNSTKRWANVYANKFLGNLEGNVAGTLTGSATSAGRLVNNTTFTYDGDVETISDTFNGNGDPKTFSLTISPTFISTKTQATNSVDSDTFIIDRNDGVDVGIRKITKQTLFQNVPGVNPVGGMLIWPGAAEPTGWKFCNGQELEVAVYAELFALLGFVYNPTPTAGFFALPDLRGRFALGLYNMGSTTPSSADNRVQTATTLGGVSGNEDVEIDVTNLPEHEHDLRSETGQQFYAFRETQEPSLPSGVLEGELEVNAVTPPSEKIPTSGGVNSATLGDPLNIVNPYIGMNYIIYTGVN